MRTANEKRHQSVRHYHLIYHNGNGVHFGNSGEKSAAGIHRAMGRTGILDGLDPDWRWSGSFGGKVYESEVENSDSKE